MKLLHNKYDTIFFLKANNHNMIPTMITELTALLIASTTNLAPAYAEDIVNPTNKPTSNPTTKPTFGVWSGTGCPQEWKQGLAYKAKDFAAVGELVYQCSSQE